VFAAGGVLSLLLTVAASAAGESAASEVELLLEEYKAATSAYYEALPDNGEPSDEAHPAFQFAPKFKTLIQRHAGNPEALPAINWFVRTVISGNTDEHVTRDAEWALELLGRAYAGAEGVRDTLWYTQYGRDVFDTDRLIRVYDRVAVANSDPETKSMALLLKGIVMLPGSAKPHGVDEAALDARRREALALLQHVEKTYPQTKAGKRATGFIFEAQRLQIGMKAPDFAGQDVEKRDLRLSDFKGRVVAVIFWGHW
jgi:hypothetical protein